MSFASFLADQGHIIQQRKNLKSISTGSGVGIQTLWNLWRSEWLQKTHNSFVSIINVHKTQARSSTLVKLAEFFKMPLWQFIQESGVAVSADDGYGWQIVGGVKSRFRYDEENANRPYPIQLVFRNLRIMNGWSIPALASKAGISQNTLRRWELGWGVGVSPEWEAKLIQIMQMGFQRVQECLLKIYSSAESVFDWITAKREYLRKVKSLSLEEVFRPHLFRAAT